MQNIKYIKFIYTRNLIGQKINQFWDSPLYWYATRKIVQVQTQNDHFLFNYFYVHRERYFCNIISNHEFRQMSF